MKFRITGGFLELEPEDDVIQTISSKLKEIAKKESEGKAFKDPSVKDLETLKRPGKPGHIIGTE